MTKILYLEKGQRVDLMRNYPDLKSITIGINHKLPKKSGAVVDLFALMLSENVLTERTRLIYYGNKMEYGFTHKDQSDGSKDKQSIDIVFEEIPEDVDEILIYAYVDDEKPKPFCMAEVPELTLSIRNPEVKETIMKFKLAGETTCLMIGKLYRDNGMVYFEAINEPFAGNIEAVGKTYNEFFSLI